GDQAGIERGLDDAFAADCRARGFCRPVGFAACFPSDSGGACRLIRTAVEAAAAAALPHRRIDLRVEFPAGLPGIGVDGDDAVVACAAVQGVADLQWRVLVIARPGVTGAQRPCRLELADIVAV